MSVNINALRKDYKHPKVKSKIGVGTSLAPKGSAASYQPKGPVQSVAGFDSDPAYQLATAAGMRDRGSADAQYTYLTGDPAAGTTGVLGAEYGIGADGKADLTNNPYSRAALLHTSYLNSQQGNTTSYAAQGQLYSGALQNARDESTRQYSIANDQNVKAYQQAVNSAQVDKSNAYSSTDNNLVAALAAVLARKTGGS